MRNQEDEMLGNDERAVNAAKSRVSADASATLKCKVENLTDALDVTTDNSDIYPTTNSPTWLLVTTGNI